jgi:membrane-associated protease RseP (regulator of RpoE activity)
VNLTVLLLIGSLALLGWSFWRARSSGKLGILVWLQSASLFSPWLIFLSLAPFGLLPSPILLIAVLVISTGSYIWLGGKLREAAREQENALRERQRLEFDIPPTADAPSVLSVELPLETSSLSDPEAPRIPDNDLQTMRGFFGIDSFFVTETLPFRQGMLFRGNLRGEAERVYTDLSTKMNQAFAERYRVFLLADEDSKPAVLVVPTDRDPFEPTKISWVVTLGLLLLTVGSLILYSSASLEFDPFQSPEKLPLSLPIVAGILFVLAVHEAGHRWQAQRYGVKLSPGYLLPLISPFPLPPLGFAIPPGTFGALTQFKTPAPTRKALFDIAIAGPALGGLISFAFLVSGFLLSVTTTQTGAFTVSADVLSTFNVLIAGLMRLRWGALPASQLIELSPLALIGIVGLSITALSLLPAGQLDGGRIVQAIYGRRIGRIVGNVTTAILAVAGFFVPSFFYWAAVLFFFARTQERPALNELTEAGNLRDILGLVALFLMAAILLPFRG